MNSELNSIPLQVQNKKVFRNIWIANILSVFSTLSINFSIGLWTLDKYDSTLIYTLIYLFTYLPSILFSPYLGAKVDRMNVRSSHIISVLSLLVNTILLVLVLLLFDNYLLYIYFFIIVNSIFNTLQWNAFQKAISSIFDISNKKEITKANGAVQSAQSISYLIAPVLSSLLLSVVSIRILLYFVVFIYVISLIIFINIKIHSTKNKLDIKNSAKQDIKEAITFMKNQPIILSLILYFTFTFFLMGIVNALIAPFILEFNNKEGLSVVLACSGLGMVIGSLIITKWGGPNKRILGVFIPIILLGLFISMAGIRNSIPLISFSGFIAFLLIPIIRGCGTSIIQTLTPYELIGRVMSLARMLSTAALPFAYLLSGIIVDLCLKPLFGRWENLRIFTYTLNGGTQINEIGILFVASGIFTMIVGLTGLVSKKFKSVY